MKIKGIILVSPVMSQMIVGQSGFLASDAIIVVNNREVFINTGKSISQIKNAETNYTIPITRIGPEKEEFEINFDIALNFFNNEMDEETKEKYKENSKLIGPFPINAELYQALNYREQLYPRMDLIELMNDLILTNQYLQEATENEIYIEDKKQLRKFIKKKLEHLSLKELETYKKTFGPLSEEESQDGEIINFLEDSKIVDFIVQLMQEIKEHKELKDMSKKELDIELLLANGKEDFERSSIIRDIISNKD